MKWWFSRDEPSPPSDRKRLAEIEDRLDSIDRTIKSIRLEWEESYDKLHHLMARVTKRQKDLARAQTESETESAEPQDAPGAPNGNEVRSHYGQHSILTEMRRRHGLLPR